MLVTAAQVKEIARSLPEYDFDYIGIRIHDGEIDANIGEEWDYLSREWVDGDPTDTLLYGVCAVSAELAAEFRLSFGAYIGSHIVILGSNQAGDGEDDGEIILRRPTVLDIITVTAEAD